MMTHTTKLWSKVPGTGYPTWDPYVPLTYMMGSYTLKARYRSAWDHKGRFTLMVRNYTLSGPEMPEMAVHNLGDAKVFVKNNIRAQR